MTAEIEAIMTATAVGIITAIGRDMTIAEGIIDEKILAFEFDSIFCEATLIN